MKKILIMAVGLFILELCQPTNAANFRGIGDLPGGTYGSQSLGVSDDGSTVVGSSIASLGQEAFIWDEEGGIRSLGEIPGGKHKGGAFDASADGSIVIGWGNTVSGIQAVQWVNEQMQVLEHLPGGETFSSGYSVSADGKYKLVALDLRRDVVEELAAFSCQFFPR